MSTLTVDIVARVNDTLKKLGATEKQIEEINAALKQTAPASKQATAAMNDMAAASAKLGNSKGLNSQIYFQAGQAISDFAIAGVRGAANNIEFLAAQLGAGGPLLIGISLASAAFFTFGDDIIRAFTPVSVKVKELREGLDEVLTIVETRNVDLFLFEDQIPSALDEAEAAVKSLQDQLAALRPAQSFGPGAAIDIFGSNDGIKELNSELAKARATLEEVRAKQEEFTRRDEAAGAGRTLSAIRENELKAETIRLDIERLGLGDSLGKISNTQLVTLEREGKLQEFIADLKKKAARSTREEVTELDRAQKKVQDLAAELEQRRRGELDTLTTLRDQAAALQAQITLVKTLNTERERQARLDAQFGAPQRAGVAALGTPDNSLAAALDTIRKAREREQADRNQNEIGAEFLRTIPDGVIEEVTNSTAEQQQALRDEFALTMDMASALAAEINYGLSDSLISLADSFGVALTSSEGFQGLGNTVLLTLADLAGNVGRIAIGTGIAIAGIKKALETLNPLVAIGAGVALVALSAAVKSKLGAAAGGGASYSGGGGAGSSLSGASQERLDALGYERLPNGAVVPAGAFQPSAPDSVSYTPLPPSPMVQVNFEGELVGEGETLRAIVRNTDKRVANTRGVAA